MLVTGVRPSHQTESSTRLPLNRLDLQQPGGSGIHHNPVMDSVGFRLLAVKHPSTHMPWTRLAEFDLGTTPLPSAGSRPTVVHWSCSQREFGKRQKPRILDRCNPMAETRILSVGCKRHERLNAVLADRHGEVPSFLGWSDQESVTTAEQDHVAAASPQKGQGVQSRSDRKPPRH